MLFVLFDCDYIVSLQAEATCSKDTTLSDLTLFSDKIVEQFADYNLETVNDVLNYLEDNHKNKHKENITIILGSKPQFVHKFCEKLNIVIDRSKDLSNAQQGRKRGLIAGKQAFDANIMTTRGTKIPIDPAYVI